MEQAVNQFNKGLQSDTHPMVQGNDTLSDALNATFVTMNGNEVVLQNDMGNRRVDNAFLPSGYEPVGIKEYGGIIYVAAYNPVTNRSQIGSFPSPERKINSLDDKSLGCNFKLFDHFYTKSQSTASTERNFISTDTVLIPITGETSLHAGDKFIIYSSEIEDWKQYLSNYDNSSESNKKAKHYKNRHITLSVGVLNAQNQFVDITKNLKRWRNNGEVSEIIKYDDTYSENYIFNDGYFISSAGTIDNPSEYTIDDRQLIRERQVIPANTYAYKLTGPLYLKAHLNHIEEFSFDIQGEKTPSLSDKNRGKLKLIITADVVYNCPDGMIGGGNTIDDYVYDGIGSYDPYQTWDGRNAFDFYIKVNGKYVKQERVNYDYEVPRLFNGEYKRTVKLSWEVSDYTGLNGILEYFIGVDAGIPLDQSDNIPYYIETLSTYGTLDLSRLGSGEADLKAFRFYNKEQNSTITYSLEIYPKIGQKFTGLLLEFKDVENNLSSITIPTSGTFPCYNGKNIVSFDWQNLIKPKRLYTVQFLYFTSDSGGRPQYIKDSDGNNVKRWLLTTNLFNNCYNPQSEDFVEDYGDRIYGKNEIYYNEKLYNKLEIKFNIEQGGSIDIVKSDSVDDTQSLIKSGEEGLIEYTTTDTYKFSGNIDDKIKISNEEQYPSSIKVINDNLKIRGNSFSLSDDLEIEVVNNGNTSILEKSQNNFSINYKDITRNILTIQSNSNSTGGSIGGEIKCNNYLLSDSGILTGNRIVNNGFNLINSEEFITSVLGNTISHSGFLVSNYDIWSGGDDEHMFALAIDVPYLTTAVKDQTYSKEVAKFVRKQDDSMVLDFSDPEIAEYYDEMSNSIRKDKTFAYVFSAINTIGNTTSDQGADTRHLAYVSDVEASGWAGIKGGDGESQGFSPINYCKVWWRNGNDDKWVLLNNYTGLFGCTDTSNDKFPLKVKNLYVYVGKDETFSDSLHNSDFTNPEDASNYYDVLYNKPRKEGIYDVANIGGINGVNIQYGIDRLVKEQIANFLDPEKKIIYSMYKETQLSDHGLYTINKNNYIYNRPYSGNVILEFRHNIPQVQTISDITQSGSSTQLLVKSEINEILPFYTSKIEENSHQFIIDIKSNENFEDDVVNIIDNEVINNIYIGNGLVRDSLGQRLSGDTIYKLVDNKLVPLTNPPYKVYRDTNGNYNSLVSIENYIGSSPSLSQYLRASGDEDGDGSQVGGDSMTALRFSGGRLRVVNYNIFQNL